MERTEIPALTGLRGVAACLVTLYHFWPKEQLSTGSLQSTVGRGYLWVDLFFILSGFVIALSYGHLFADGIRPAAMRSFLIRRLARLYPLYFAVLLWQIACSLTANGGLQAVSSHPAVTVAQPATDISFNLLMVQSWGLAGSIVGTAWSVSTEVALYLLFPLLAVLTLFRNWRAALVIGVVAAAMLIAVARLDALDGEFHRGALDAYDGQQLTPLMRCFGGFVLGLLAFRLNRLPLVAAVAASDAVGFAVLGLLLVLFATDAHDLAIIALFPTVILCFAENRGRMSRLLTNRPALVLGKLSYAIYLLNPLSTAQFQRLIDLLHPRLATGLAASVAGVVVGGGLLLLAAAVHVWIEKPGGRLIRNIQVFAGQS